MKCKYKVVDTFNGHEHSRHKTREAAERAMRALRRKFEKSPYVGKGSMFCAAIVSIEAEWIYTSSRGWKWVVAPSE